MYNYSYKKGVKGNMPFDYQKEKETQNEKPEKIKNMECTKDSNSIPSQIEEEKQNKIIDFDYSLLKPLLTNIDNKKENIILLTTGSFNPIHRMHLEILNLAYKFLLDKNKYNIICGFISPSADCYVKNKKPPLIPFDLRCKMIETAINDYQLENKDNELKIFLHKWEGSHNYFIDFPYVIDEIQKKLFDYNIRLVYVCGMDLYLNVHFNLHHNVIAVDRKPYKNQKYKDNPQNFVFFIKDEKCKPYSSTSIRELFKKKKIKEIENATFPTVAKMIIDYYQSIQFN